MGFIWEDRGRSNSASSSKLVGDDQATALTFGVVLFVIAGVLMKFLPLIVGGIVLGRVLYCARFQEKPADKWRVYFGALGFFAFICFCVIGAPLNSGPKKFEGALWISDTLWGGFSGAIRVWNGLFQSGFFKSFRFTNLSYPEVSAYFWGTIAAGVIFSLIFFATDYWKKKQSKSSDFKISVAEIPAGIFGLCVDFSFGRYIKGGYRHSGDPIVSQVLPFLLIYGVGYATNYYLVPRIPFTDLRFVLSVILFLPAIGNVLGFVLGKIPGGGEIVSAVFVGDAHSLRQESDKFILGHTFQGHPFHLTEKNLAYHVEIVAPSGAGKTNTLKNLLADRIKRGHGVFFLDLKGDFDVAAWMYRAAKAGKREQEVRLLSLADRELSVPFNPVKYGSAPEIHSQIMASLTWSEDFYRKISSIALMTLSRALTEYRDKTGELFHLGHIYELLDRPGALRAFNERLVKLGCQSAREVEILAEKLDRPSERNNLMGLTASLNSLIYSAAGPLMSEDTVRGSYDLREAINEGRITYLLMNSLLLKESASVFGKMILQDFMSFVGGRYAKTDDTIKQRPITFIIDEFANFATPEFIEFMDRARGAGIGIVMAHQARADLRSISPEFQERVEANSNTTIVSGIKSSQDAEYYAGMVGTQTTKKETKQVETGIFWDSDTGMKSIREVEEYVVHPNKIKDLSQGEVFAISRTVDPRWALVRIPQAPEFREPIVTSAELREHFRTVREAYLKGTTEKYLVLDPVLRPVSRETKVDSVLQSIPKTDRKLEPGLWS